MCKNVNVYTLLCTFFFLYVACCNNTCKVAVKLQLQFAANYRNQIYFIISTLQTIIRSVILRFLH